jgi:hypothetical protein
VPDGAPARPPRPRGGEATTTKRERKAKTGEKVIIPTPEEWAEEQLKNAPPRSEEWGVLPEYWHDLIGMESSALSGWLDDDGLKDQLIWVLLARESTDRERQLGNQLTDLRAQVARIGGRIDREIPENAVSAFKRQRVELPDGTYGYRVVRPEWENILTALQGRGQSRCSCILNCCYVASWTFRGACGMRDGWMMRGLS